MGLALRERSYDFPAELRVDPQHAEQLIARIAGGDDSSSVAQVFDRVLFPLALWFAEHRARWHAKRMLRRTNFKDIFVPSRDVEDVVQAAAANGLRRSRERARDYDAARGDPVTWILGNVALEYIKVVRNLRGRGEIEFPSDEDLARLTWVPTSALPPAELRAELASILDCIPEQERDVLIRHDHYGETYEEIAVGLFGSSSHTKRVEHLLRGARAKARELLDGPRSKRRHLTRRQP